MGLSFSLKLFEFLDNPQRNSSHPGIEQARAPFSRPGRTRLSIRHARSDASPRCSQQRHRPLWRHRPQRPGTHPDAWATHPCTYKMPVIIADHAGLSLADETKNITTAAGDVQRSSQLQTLAQIRQAVATRAEEAYSTLARWETEALKNAPWHPLGLYERN